MNRILVCCLLIIAATVARADQAVVGRAFPPFALADQFGSNHTLRTETRFVVIAAEKEVSTRINDWLSAKPAGFLDTRAMVYIADIEKMPAIITRLFALPKMRKLPFTLLLATDPSFAATYPREPGRIGLFILDANHVLRAIHHLDQPGELDALLNRETP